MIKNNKYRHIIILQSRNSWAQASIYFDATKIWGPIMGRNLYLGMRYEIKKKNSDKTITF